MGCDIHFFAEHRRDSESPWEFLPAPAFSADYRYGSCDTSKPGFEPGYDNRHEDAGVRGWMRDWFDDRNYELFGALADVRNCASRPVIAQPRGWPSDCCPELADERDMIEHTPTWLLVSEMLAYFARQGGDYSERFEACLREMLDASGRGPENVRAVFYFDN